MKHLGAFFLAAGRPAMFFWFPLSLGIVWVVTLVMTDPDFPIVGTDMAFTRAFGFPAITGLLAGLVVQELQHCSFVWPLPGVRWKTCLGFLVAGVVISSVVASLVSLSASAHNVWTLFAVALAAYCVGSLLFDPVLGAVRVAGFTVVLAALLFSARIGEFCAAHGAIVVVVALPAVGLCLLHRFGATSFRRLPFVPVAELAGSFSLEHAARRERGKLKRRRRTGRSWWSKFIGHDVRSWVRAGFFESFGALAWRDIPRIVVGPLMIVLLFVGHASDVKGDDGLLTAFLETIHRGLLMPPHLGPYPGENSPYDLTAIVVSLAGLFFAFVRSSALDPRRYYPLSRSELARVTYWFNFGICAVYYLSVNVVLLVVAIVSGLIVGLEPRMDFVPLVFRTSTVTLILLPIAQWVRLRGSTRPQPHALTVAIVGTVVFVIFVTTWSLAAARVFTAPWVELAFLSVLIVASQAVFHGKLRQFFVTEDLV